MNEDQITKFIVACKNAGFEVVEGSHYQWKTELTVKLKGGIAVVCDLYEDQEPSPYLLILALVVFAGILAVKFGLAILWELFGEVLG